MTIHIFSPENLIEKRRRGRKKACIFNARNALNGHFMKLISWYDNEYGFTCNMMRLLAYIAQVKG